MSILFTEDASRAAMAIAMAALFVLPACSGAGGTSSPGGAEGETPSTPGPEEVGQITQEQAPEVSVPRLTAAQYIQSLHDIFGEDVIVPTNLEPDISASGSKSIGAGLSSISPRGVEQYEDAALAIAEQVTSEAIRDRIATCTPSGPSDVACMREVLGPIGHDLYRRPMAQEDVERLANLGVTIAEQAQNFWVGARFALAAMLQSPQFLFRAELGAGDGRALDDWEMASRLSFFLWNTTPDAALLEAAERGELTDDATLEQHVRRMLDDPRARRGMRAFFSDVLDLDDLDDLSKDPTVFTVYAEEVGPYAKEQTLLTLEDIIFDRDADFRNVITTRRTFLNRKLASMYGVVSPAREGFAAIELPEETERVGLLGHASFLSLQAHPVSSSATLRGRFIRERLLCQSIPSPPAGVDTSIPEPSGEAPTLRARVEEHLQDEQCAGCHNLMDPLGLAYENFNGVGVWRDEDNGHPIDTSGNFDGDDFETPSELAELIRNHPALTGCMVEHMMRYATSSKVRGKQRVAVDVLDVKWAADGFRFKELIVDFALSPIFRTTRPAAPPEDDTTSPMNEEDQP